MTNEELRERFVKEVLEDFSDGLQLRDFVSVLAKTMEFLSEFDDLPGSDKKQEALLILAEVLDQTDIWGPDVIVDTALLLFAEVAIDYLYDAARGKFGF